MPRIRPPRGAPTSADLVVLSLLAERPMHGYELLQEYDRQEVEDWASVSRAHVYYALTKLAGAGLIAEAKRAAGAPTARAVPYRVTPKGRRVLARALDDDAWATRPHVPPFVTWLGLSIHATPAARARVIAARVRVVAARLAQERATLAAIRADTGARVGVAAWMVGLLVEQLELEARWLAAWGRDGVGA
ncbi:MAG: PadR family transcriptional regulator [Gemmatimonadetes bacterium]|nr:PadR family transcriptional regulator [Gemmatimonadota bacterium]